MVQCGIFLALSLLCSVQAQECVSFPDLYDWEVDEDFSCGCQLRDADNNTIVNIALDFIEERYVINSFHAMNVSI